MQKLQLVLDTGYWTLALETGHWRLDTGPGHWRLDTGHWNWHWTLEGMYMSFGCFADGCVAQALEPLRTGLGWGFAAI